MTDREIRRENNERMREQIQRLQSTSTVDAQHETNAVWEQQMPPMFSNCEVDGVMHPIRGNPNYPAHSPGWIHPSYDATYVPVQLKGGTYKHEGWYNEKSATTPGFGLQSYRPVDDEINSLEERIKLHRSQVSARPKFARV